MQDELTMKQRLWKAVKMEWENAVQVASYVRDDVEEFLQDVPAPQIMSGEVVPTATERGDGYGEKGWAIRDTLATPHTAAIAASLERTELLSQSYGIDVLALGIDAANSVGANNSLEKMLAHQMALAHKTSFQLADRAMHKDSVEAAQLIKASARMMTVYQQALLALNQLRTGGKQTVTVPKAQTELIQPPLYRRVYLWLWARRWL